MNTELDQEILRLRELMPASGRMFVRLQPRPKQAQVLVAPRPRPWNPDLRPIYLNLHLWQQLPRSQRDLLFLRAVAWLVSVPWFQPTWYQGLALVSLTATAVELSRGEVMGLIVAGGLTTLATRRVWRDWRGPQRDLEADEAAIATAQRRGYSRATAAAALLAGLESVAQIEGRRGLSFREAVRAQQLRAIAQTVASHRES